MRAGIENGFQGFKSIADNGALLGPWNPWLHEPKFGKPIWELTKVLSFSPPCRSRFERWRSSLPARNFALHMKFMPMSALVDHGVV
jgi:hypothetical protein